MFIVDANRRLAGCNLAFASALGVAVDRLEGKPVAALGDLLGEITNPEALNRIFQTGETATREAEVRERWFAVTADPIKGEKDSTVAVVHIANEITDRKLAEDETSRRRDIIRDLLWNVTNGRLNICESCDGLPPELIRVGRDLPLTLGALGRLRDAVMNAAGRSGFARARAHDIVTAASEAAMNAIVHANGGFARVNLDGKGIVQVRVTDHGCGIAWDRLPLAAIVPGCAAAGTLGHGLKVIIRTADRVWLCTGPQGTTIVLEQNRVAPEHSWPGIPEAA
jgi:PAS domain S-box-containing protein